MNKILKKYKKDKLVFIIYGIYDYPLNKVVVPKEIAKDIWENIKAAVSNQDAHFTIKPFNLKEHKQYLSV